MWPLANKTRQGQIDLINQFQSGQQGVFSSEQYVFEWAARLR